MAVDPEPKQTEFTLTPDYVEENGVKHEFNGTLFVPLAGQSVPPSPSAILEAFSVSLETVPVYQGTRRMKMNPITGLKLGGHV
jgi:hypothetical protein